MTPQPHLSWILQWTVFNFIVEPGSKFTGMVSADCAQVQAVLSFIPPFALAQEYLTDFNDTLLAIYLASMTKGVNACNEIVDKFSLAYEKSSRRRPVM